MESFAEDPADKGPKAFVRGEVIQPGQRPSDSGAALSPLISNTCRKLQAGHSAQVWHTGEPPRRAGKYVPKFLPPSMAAALAAPEGKLNLAEVAEHESSCCVLPSSIAFTLRHLHCVLCAQLSCCTFVYRDAVVMMSCSQLCHLYQRLLLVAKANSLVKLMRS